jgi:hypothetical protein
VLPPEPHTKPSSETSTGWWEEHLSRGQFTLLMLVLAAFVFALRASVAVNDPIFSGDSAFRLVGGCAAIHIIENHPMDLLIGANALRVEQLWEQSRYVPQLVV